MSEQKRVIMLPASAPSVSYTPAVPADWVPSAPTTAQQALDMLATMNPGEYVFRPGDPVGPHDHVFTDWATLIAAYNAQAHFSGTIIFDDTFAAITLPAGVWSVTYDMVWSGWHIGITTHVVLADGFHVVGATGIGISELTNDIMVHTQASSAGSNVSPLTVSVPSDVLIVQYGAKVIADGDLPLIAVPTGMQLIIALYLAGEILFGSTPVFTVALGSQIVILSPTFGTVEPATFAGAGDLFTLIAVVNPNIHTTAAEQPGVTGAVTVQLGTEAHFCGYTPATPGDWNGVPVNAGEAIDRLAAAVAGLLGGPVP